MGGIERQSGRLVSTGQIPVRHYAVRPSLSQLQKLKMDVLKVDKAFTCELDNSTRGCVFFQAIVSMAHALGMSLVAEGVETSRQHEILRELRCNEVQGYYISSPQPPLELAALMRKRWLLPEEIAMTS